MRILNWAATTAVCMSATCTFSQHKLDGKVLSEGKPIPGAVITLSSEDFRQIKPFVSDAQGLFSYINLKPGSYVLEARMLGYEHYKRSFKLTDDLSVDIVLIESAHMVAEYEVRSTKVDAPNASALGNGSGTIEALKAQNLGQDLPMLLNWTPNVVTTSDAGAGVGYTGIRIRGSDGTRINVTVNGIPINDAESHGTFWVNMPDMTSSLNQIQVVRGVGNSTNGAGAFGASINMQTGMMSDEAFGEVSNSFGSFNTRKHTVQFGTGWMGRGKHIKSYEGFKTKTTKGEWAIEGRLSGIFSDGYIDRANSNLRSYYLQGAYRTKKTLIRAISFAGKERTYQSWWGTPEAVVKGDKDALDEHYWNNAGAYPTTEDSVNLYNSGRTYNYYRYKNEVDNYQQDHYQLHLTHQFSKELTLHTALFYTYGRGYYEQFRYKDDLAHYGLSYLYNIDGNGDTLSTITNGDVVRRRWLDNNFFGGVFSLHFDKKKLSLILGGGFNRYDGSHFGEVIWSEYAQNGMPEQRYYQNNSVKDDANIYLRGAYRFNARFTAEGDLQGRIINYKCAGFDNDMVAINFSEQYTFFNPKAALKYALGKGWQDVLNLRIGVAHREPVRNDIIDAIQGTFPTPERLIDFEFGYQHIARNWNLAANIFHMDYKNQLVPTGALNDVGAIIRTNVPYSYRSGIELMGQWSITRQFLLQGNVSYSLNRIKNFTEVLYDYSTVFGIVENEYSNTPIAFSPPLVGAIQMMYKPFKGNKNKLIKDLELALLNKYVSRQFLDNTGNINRSLAPYFVTDFRLSWTIRPNGGIKEIGIYGLINNLLNTMYSSNGYTYSYIYGSLITENFLYPQAGINFLGGVSFRF